MKIKIKANSIYERLQIWNGIFNLTEKGLQILAAFIDVQLITEDEIKLSLTGLWFRVNDKVQRIKNLLMGNRESAVDEPLEDAFLDMSNYGIMATIVKNGKWGK